MPNKSPLRYPGGKTRAISLLHTEVERFPGKTLLSPFLGGGSFELFLQSKGYTVYANDFFQPLATFWETVQARPQALVDAVRSYGPITKEIFGRLRSSIMTMTDPLEIAAAYYIVNRCSFSGATFCGGFSQQAATGRLNDAALKRLLEVDLRGVVLSRIDCIAFLDAHPQGDNTLVYADPPYYIENYIYGNNGDMHEAFNHVALAEALHKRTDWILCYNDCLYIRNLYADCSIKSVSWAYGMNAKKGSSEIIITRQTP